MVRRKVLKVIKDYPEFHEALDDAFQNLGELCDKRNALAHGLWKSVADGIYELQPLKFSKKDKKLGDVSRIDLKYLGNVKWLMDGVWQQFASLGTEMIAHQWLEKVKQKRLAAGSLVNKKSHQVIDSGGTQ